MKELIYGLNPEIKLKSGVKIIPVKMDIKNEATSSLAFLNSYGIDHESLLELCKQQCNDEALLELCKQQCNDEALKDTHRHIMSKLTDQSENIDSITDLHKILNKKKKPISIITNTAVGALIMDQPFFQACMFKDNNELVGLPLLIGEYNDVKTFIDPMMRWDDTRIYLLYNNFYNFEIFQEMTDSIITSNSCVKCNKPKYKIYNYDKVGI